jgi:general secretion pathway protein N
MAGHAMSAARAAAIMLTAACTVAPAFAALDSAAPPGLADVEQFPIVLWAVPPGQPIVAPPAAAQAQPGNPLWAVPLRTLSATRERPIFSPSRRPPPAAVVAIPAEPAPQAAPRPVVAERPALALVGTIVGEGERIAIFYNSTTRTTMRLRLGETDDAGWKLVAVDARTTLLEKGPQSVTLALPVPGETPAGVPASRPAGNAEPDL